MDLIDQRGELLGGEGVEALTKASLAPALPRPLLNSASEYQFNATLVKNRHHSSR